MKRFSVLFIAHVAACTMVTMAVNPQGKVDMRDVSKLQKEGWIPEPGMPSIVQQLANTQQLIETHPDYYCQEMSAIAPTFAEAFAQAYFHCLSYLIDNTCKYCTTEITGNYNSDEYLFAEKIKRTVELNLEVQYTMTESRRERYISDERKREEEENVSKEETIFILDYKSFTNVENLGGHLNSKSTSDAIDYFTNEIDAIKLQSFYRVLKDGNVEVRLLLAREIQEPVDIFEELEKLLSDENGK